MEKILFLGSDSLTIEMLEYAKSQGVYTIVTDYHPPEKSYAKSIADEYWMINYSQLDEVEQKCREENVTAVTCGINEFAQDQVIELCERLHLPSYCTKESWHYNRNKADFKDACKKVGLPVAEDYILSDALTDEELDKVQFPVVVKPVDKCLNNGVSFCHNKEELIRAYRYARSVSDNPRIIVERMITGEELLGYYVLADGEVSLLGVIDSYAPPGKENFCYILNTTAVEWAREYIANTDPYAKKLLKEIGCREGFAFIQYKHEDSTGKIYAIEMGYRLAGCLVYIGMEDYNHFNAIHWMTDCALGRKHTPDMLPKSMDRPWVPCVCTCILWTKRAGTVSEIIGLEDVKRTLPIKYMHSYVKPGAPVKAYRFAFSFVFSAENCDEMCEMIKKINSLISLKDENGEDMLLRYTDFTKVKEAYRKSLAESAQ